MKREKTETNNIRLREKVVVQKEGSSAISAVNVSDVIAVITSWHKCNLLLKMPEEWYFQE